MEVRIEESWKEILKEEFDKPYFKELTEFVRTQYLNEAVYPAPSNVFRAFDLCPFEKVEVVILGQDPYHGTGQANGLSFAVSEGTPLPPSLKNIYKEIENDLEKKMENASGDLSRWATQGVLLLNATLTVMKDTPGSHQHHGWEEFTDACIAALSEKRENLVFILWGNCAKAKGAHVDTSKHCMITSPHPSPFSARNGFFGSKPFSKTNEYLLAHNKKPIEWLS